MVRFSDTVDVAGSSSIFALDSLRLFGFGFVFSFSFVSLVIIKVLYALYLIYIVNEKANEILFNVFDILKPDICFFLSSRPRCMSKAEKV